MLRSCNVKFRHNQAEHRLIIICANKYECYSGIPVMKKEDQETPCANFVYFFSYPFCKSNLPHQKRKICFLMLWFFFLTKLNHSALCVCWYTWHSTKHVNPHKLTLSYLSPLHEGVALPCVSLAVMLWEGGAAAVHLCRRSLCSPRVANTWRSEKSDAGLCNFCCYLIMFWRGGKKLKCGTSLWPQRCVWCVNGGTH